MPPNVEAIDKNDVATPDELWAYQQFTINREEYNADRLAIEYIAEVEEMDRLYFEIDWNYPLINTSNKYKPVRGNTYYIRGDWDNPKTFTRQQTRQATRRWRRMGRYDGLCDFDVFECQARSLIGWDERYYW